jgi:hypothetical protein
MTPSVGGGVGVAIGSGLVWIRRMKKIKKELESNPLTEESQSHEIRIQLPESSMKRPFYVWGAIFWIPLMMGALTRWNDQYSPAEKEGSFPLLLFMYFMFALIAWYFFILVIMSPSYIADSNGIRKFSRFSRNIEARWDEVETVHPDASRNYIIIKTRKGKMKVFLEMDGAVHFLALMTNKLPHEKWIKEEPIVQWAQTLTQNSSLFIRR